MNEENEQKTIEIKSIDSIISNCIFEITDSLKIYIFVHSV